MKSSLILVTGGCRSGKSRYAQSLAESLSNNKAYLATCPVIDSEMQHRIQRHQADREHRNWTTLEAPIHLAEAIASASSFTVILIDCLTLWINNLMFEAEKIGQTLTEDDIVKHTHAVIHAAQNHHGTCIFVTNEVGLGIVPLDATTRQFRDLAGITNQTIAHAADEVSFIACGIPLHLKSKSI